MNYQPYFVFLLWWNCWTPRLTEWCTCGMLCGLLLPYRVPPTNCRLDNALSCLCGKFPELLESSLDDGIKTYWARFSDDQKAFKCWSQRNTILSFTSSLVAIFHKRNLTITKSFESDEEHKAADADTISTMWYNAHEKLEDKNISCWTLLFRDVHTFDSSSGLFKHICAVTVQLHACEKRNINNLIY